MRERIGATDLKPNKFLIEEPHTCFHCGNTGLLKYIGKAGWKNELLEDNDYGIVEHSELFEHEDWYIFQCPVCHKPVLKAWQVFSHLHSTLLWLVWSRSAKKNTFTY